MGIDTPLDLEGNSKLDIWMSSLISSIDRLGDSSGESKVNMLEAIEDLTDQIKLLHEEIERSWKENKSTTQNMVNELKDTNRELGFVSTYLKELSERDNKDKNDN